MIKLKDLILEKTLYHGTLIDNVPSIKKYGLMPSVGDFVKDCYESDIIGCGCDPDDYLKELVFASDKNQLSKAVNAITAQVGKKIGKGFHDVTDDDFIKYGAIAKIYDGESVLEQRPEGDENYRGQYPHTVEPGDYYSEDYVGVDEMLTGQPMIRLLKRYGEWPRTWYSSMAGDMRWLKAELIRLAIKYHKDRSKKDIINAVMDIRKRDSVINQIRKYKDLVNPNKLNEMENGYKEDIQEKVRNLESSLEKEFPQLQFLSIYLTSAGNLYIDSLKVKQEERKKGIGRKVMEKILKFADDNHLYTTLHMVPDRGYKEKLNQFYRSFGFVPNAGRRKMYQYSNPFYSTMIRRPK